MANKNDTTFFENKLLDFVTAKDPMLEMLQWVMDKFMEIEVAHKTGAKKGIHAKSRTGYRCGYRIRRFDTRLCRNAGWTEFQYERLRTLQKDLE